MEKQLWWFIEVSKALLPFVLAGIAAWIAWQQMMTAKRKLRLDLFDKRLEVYRFFNDFAYHTLAFSDSNKLDEMLCKFDEMEEMGYLLYGDRVRHFISELNKASSHLYRQRRDGLRDDDARDAFDACHEKTREAMESYLRFDAVR